MYTVKKQIKTSMILIYTLSIALLMLNYSCNDDDFKNQPAAEEAFVYNSIKILETDYHADSTTIYLLKGQELQLNYLATPSDGVTYPEIEWTSTNEAVVTVTKTGKITAKNVVGRSTVQLTPAIGFGATNATPSVVVNVLDSYIYMTGVSILNPLLADGMIDVGQTYQLEASSTTSGEPATFERYNWTSSDPAIAKVDIKTGLVTGVSEGTVTITLKPDDQNPNPPASAVATTEIRVRKVIPVETLELIADPELAGLGYGQEYQIKFNVTPANATVSSIIWTSDNEAGISVDNKGKITVNSLDASMATITATAGSIVKTLNVAVARGRLCYSFANKFTPWKVTTGGALVQASDGVKTTIQMSNPTNTGTAKHRADINLVTNNSGEILVVHPNVYRYLAVKMQFPTVLVPASNSNGVIKLEMFDNPRTIGPVYRGSGTSDNNQYKLFNATEVSTTEPNVFVFDLFETAWSGGFVTNTNPYNLVQFKFVIADFPVAAPWTYDIYWLRTFKSMTELQDFIAAGN